MVMCDCNMLYASGNTALARSCMHGLIFGDDVQSSGRGVVGGGQTEGNCDVGVV